MTTRRALSVGATVLLTILGVSAPLTLRDAPPAPGTIAEPAMKSTAIQPALPFAAFAEQHPEAYQRMIAVSTKRGWTPTRFAVQVGQRVSREDIRARRQKATPTVPGGTLRSVQYSGDAKLRPAQYFEYFGDWAGEVVFWEWYCGDYSACFDVLVYDNEYGEEIGFSVQWTPTSESDGDVTWSDTWFYDYGALFDEYGGSEEDPPLIDSALSLSTPSGSTIRKVQGGFGACILARFNCLKTNVPINFKSALKWGVAQSFFSCLPVGVAWSGVGYLGCVPFNQPRARA